MVRSAAAHVFEEGDALVHGRADVGEGLDFHAGSFAEAGHVFGVTGLIDVQQFVRAHSRVYLGAAGLFFFQLLMPFQIVSRVVGRADDLDVGLFDEALDAHVGVFQLGVALFEDFFGVLFIERFGNAEVALQL